MNPSLHSLTSVFVDKYASNEDEKQEALDPTTFFAFAELILELIAKIKECRGTDVTSVKQIANKPKLGQRLVLRSHLIEAMGRKEFRKSGEKVQEALFAAADDADNADIVQVWDSI